MANVCRITDPSTVFYECTPDIAQTGSTDTFVNGLGVHRKTDRWTPHSCADQNTYYAILQEGAPTHFTNNLPTGRVGDPVLRYEKIAGPNAFRTGSAKVASGSPDTFVGGSGSPAGGDPYFRAGKARAGDKLYTIFS
tara:strand:- start:1153 stop:1563 length:411 start_codon:yes stop_codon:yes gene_type:complete